MCCSAPAAHISATSHMQPATSGYQVPDALRSRASIASRGARRQRTLHRDLSWGFRPGLDRAGCHGEHRRRRAEARAIPFAALHRQPGDTPDLETTLRAGELIVFFSVPSEPWTRRSLYLKVRDRKSYEFALASAAVALDLDGTRCAGAHRAWRGCDRAMAAKGEAEARRRTIDDQSTAAAAEAAFANASGHEHNEFKIELGKRTLGGRCGRRPHAD